MLHRPRNFYFLATDNISVNDIWQKQIVRNNHVAFSMWVALNFEICTEVYVFAYSAAAAVT